MKYYRMNGLGNQFYVFDLRGQAERGYQELHNLTQADYDQLVVMLDSDKADCFMKIYNIDGSLVEACGNATRCVARLISTEQNKNDVTIETVNRLLNAKKIRDNYQVEMGIAKTEWQDIPLAQELDAREVSVLNEAKFGKGFCVNVGNPHIVFFVADLDEVNLEKEVSHLERNELFPEGVNINVAQIISSKIIKAKTWERGAGATLACGTGACATFFAANQRDLVGLEVRLDLPGGALDISLNESNEILMTGDANLELSMENE